MYDNHDRVHLNERDRWSFHRYQFEVQQRLDETDDCRGREGEGELPSLHSRATRISNVSI